jgi:putative salt-induced outer membrane protein
MNMRKLTLALLVGAAFNVQAGEWVGTGELGLAISRGNAEADTLNTKLDFKKEDEQWLYNVFADALRVKASDDLTANRYQLGGKAGHKYTERMYFFGAARYDSDDFAPYEYQFVLSAGVGYYFIKEEGTQLVGEIGPAWRRYQPIDQFVIEAPGLVEQDSESDAIARASIDFKHSFSETTSVYDTLLVESGGGQTFMQNDLGLSVKMNEQFALKTGLQVRRNSKVPLGVDKTDKVLTTNIVMTF